MMLKIYVNVMQKLSDLEERRFVINILRIFLILSYAVLYVRLMIIMMMNSLKFMENLNR